MGRGIRAASYPGEPAEKPRGQSLGRRTKTGLGEQRRGGASGLGRWDGSKGFPQEDLGQGGTVLTWAQPGDPRGRALGWHSVCVGFEETHE